MSIVKANVVVGG